MTTNAIRIVLALCLTVATLCMADDNPIATTPLYSNCASLQHAGQVTAVTFSPDGKILAVGGSQENPAGSANLVGTVKLWDVGTRKPLQTLKHGGSEVNCVAFASDGKTIVSGSTGSLKVKNGTLKLWNLATGQEVAVFNSGVFSVRAVAFSPNAKLVAAGDSKGIITIWRIATREKLARFQGNKSTVPDVAFAPDGKTLAAAGGKSGEANVVKLWDVSTAKATQSLPGSSKEQVTAVAYTTDGTLLASTRGKLAIDVLLWDTTTWKSRPADGGSLATTSLAFSPDGKLLAVADNFGFVALVDVKSGKRKVFLASGLSDVRSVAFAPDGKTVAAAGMNSVTLWEVEKAVKVKKKN